MTYQDINPYRPVEYFRGADHSRELYDQMVAPIARQREQQESDRTNNYRNASLQRETQRDERNDSRERVGQQQRAQEMLMQDRRSGQREDLYALQEKRRQDEAMFNRHKLHQAEHEQLIHELYESINAPGQDPVARQNRISAAQEALHRAGYGTAVNEDTPKGPTLPSPFPEAAAPPPGASPAQPQGMELPIKYFAGGAGLPPVVQPGSGGAALHFTPKAPPADMQSLGAEEPGAIPGARPGGPEAAAPVPWLPGKSPIARGRVPAWLSKAMNAGTPTGPDLSPSPGEPAEWDPALQ